MMEKLVQRHWRGTSGTHCVLAYTCVVVHTCNPSQHWKDRGRKGWEFNSIQDYRVQGQTGPRESNKRGGKKGESGGTEASIPYFVGILALPMRETLSIFT